MPASQPSPKKRGRPATGKTRVKITATVPSSLEELAKKIANKKGESFSNFVSRALQNLVLES